MQQETHNDKIYESSRRLLVDSFLEMAKVLGHSSSNPVSISLLCIQLGITNDAREKILLAILRTLDRHTEKELSVALFRKVIEQYLPPSENPLSDHIVVALLKGYARSLVPELMPFVSHLVLSDSSV